MEFDPVVKFNICTECFSKIENPLWDFSYKSDENSERGMCCNLCTKEIAVWKYNKDDEFGDHSDSTYYEVKFLLLDLLSLFMAMYINSKGVEQNAKD